MFHKESGERGRGGWFAGVQRNGPTLFPLTDITKRLIYRNNAGGGTGRKLLLRRGRVRARVKKQSLRDVERIPSSLRGLWICIGSFILITTLAS
jgi:hypothetical protein